MVFNFKPCNNVKVILMYAENNGDHSCGVTRVHSCRGLSKSHSSRYYHAIMAITTYRNTKKS